MTTQRVWEPQKRKIGPLEPANDPHLGHFVCILGHLGPKKMRFSQKKFCRSKSLLNHPRRVWDPQKPEIGPQWPLRDPIWANLGAFWAIWTCFGLLWPILACFSPKGIMHFRAGCVSGTQKNKNFGNFFSRPITFRAGVGGLYASK